MPIFVKNFAILSRVSDLLQDFRFAGMGVKILHVFRRNTNYKLKKPGLDRLGRTSGKQFTQNGNGSKLNLVNKELWLRLIPRLTAPPSRERGSRAAIL
jgi:hypothetical protein